jgi:uncharacterized protein (DUF302 family)
VSYALRTTVTTPYPQTVDAVKAALSEQGFGVLTEIDMKVTLKQKLDVDVPAQVILGACRPPLAYASLTAEPSIGLLLPCNVVVRETEDGTVVEAVDPQTMVALTDNVDLQPVADEAKERLEKALASLSA